MSYIKTTRTSCCFFIWDLSETPPATLERDPYQIREKEWIVPISNSLQSIKTDIRQLELFTNASAYEKTPALAEVYSRWGAVVEEVRTAFARRNDATVYIPALQAITF